jgi:hypothetical protein
MCPSLGSSWNIRHRLLSGDILYLFVIVKPTMDDDYLSIINDIHG